MTVCIAILHTYCSKQPENTGRFPVTIEGKRGYIDKQGEIVIEPKFDQASHFSEGLAAVQVDGKWGFINTSGYIVIEPRFEKLGSFYFYEGLFPYQVSDKYGFIDKTGKIAIEPEFDEVNLTSFRGGLAAVRVNDKWGYIDRSGKYVITPKYTTALEFSSGLATVAEAHDWPMKVIDKTGTVVIDEVPTFTYFYDNIGLIRLAPDYLCYYVDKKGKKIFEKGYLFARLFHDGLAAVFITEEPDQAEKASDVVMPESHTDVNGIRGYPAEFYNGKWGYINKAGELVIEPQFDDVFGHGFYEGLSPVKIGDSWGYVDTRGNIAIEPQYDQAGGFRNGVASVSKEDEYYYINKKGEIIWTTERGMGLYHGGP
jgi:hypothetical protein